MKSDKRIATKSKNKTTPQNQRIQQGKSSPGSKENMSVFGNNYMKWLKTNSKILAKGSPVIENSKNRWPNSPPQLIKYSNIQNSQRLSNSKNYPNPNSNGNDRSLTPTNLNKYSDKERLGKR